MPPEEIALVTGASSGIGRITARTLAENGYRVFGTSRQPSSPTLDGFELIALDVTQPASIQACIDEVLGRAGRLDVLVNNAGVELLGALEEITIDEAKQLFDVNFFGVARVTQAVLPHMRSQQRGTIINVSSTAGLVSGAFQGYYAATKHALEAYTEALWYEVEPFNIRVALVEPGIFHSEIARGRIRPGNDMAAYRDIRNRVIDIFEGYIARGATPDPVAQKILQIANGNTRGLRHIVASWDMKTARLARVVPFWLQQLYGKIWFGYINIPFLPRNRHHDMR